MLQGPEVAPALAEAARLSGRCRPTCRLGSSVEPGAYRVWHNGVGRDSDEQAISSPTRLAMSAEHLTSVLRFWLDGLHGGAEPLDLNGPLG